MLVQLIDALVGGPAAEIRDLEIALRHLHARVELQCAHERADRFLVQALVVVQDAEVVVRAGVAGIDATGERAEHGEITLGRERTLP